MKFEQIQFRLDKTTNWPNSILLLLGCRLACKILRLLPSSQRRFESHTLCEQFAHLQISPICTSAHPRIHTSKSPHPHTNPPILRRNPPLMLCMHKKRTEYRFELWYKLLNILYLYTGYLPRFILTLELIAKLNTN